MPRYVQVVRMCENHPDRPASDEEIPPVTWGRGRPLVFDACDECVTKIVGPFRELLAKGTATAGVASGGKRTAPAVAAPQGAATGSTTCPLCDDPPVLKDRQTLSKHLRGVHGKGIRGLRAEGVDV